MATHFLGSLEFLVSPLCSGRFDLHGRIPDLAIPPTISGKSHRVRRPTILGHLKKPLFMTSEVMDSNFPLSDTADIANDR